MFIKINSQSKGINTTQINRVPTLKVDGCIFDNISMQTSIIEDEAYISNVYIADLFIHIISGMVYTSHHSFVSPVEVDSVSLKTSKRYNTGEYGLF